MRDHLEFLAGRVALVTGSTGGVGRAIVDRLAAAGVDLALSARGGPVPSAHGGPTLDAQAAAVRAAGVRCVALPADLRDPAAVDGLLDRAEAALGPVDLLVNNAAVDLCAPFDDVADPELATLVDVNLVAPLRLTRRAVARMLAGDGGHVVFVSSLSGFGGTAYQAAYAATKAALVGLSHSLRAEYVDRPVGFSVVAPGPVGGAGMFARRRADGARLPRALRATTPEAVARSVTDAVRTDAPLVCVTPGPVRPLLAFALLAPRVAERVAARLGVGRMFEAAARSRGA